MTEQRPDIERAIEAWREPVRMDAALDARVMAEVGRLPALRPEPAWRRTSRWLVRGRTVRLSPLTALAAAAGIVLVTLMGQQGMRPGSPTASTPSTPSAASTAPSVQFVVVIPNAGSVALVGDFNDWDQRATPMAPVAGDGVWTVTVPLAPGRYRYSFLVDGETWLADPAAPRGLEDDFGRPNSVLTVGGT